MNEIVGMTKLIFLDSIRNRVEFFFTVMFPIVFLIIFGFVFAGSSESGKYTVGLVSDLEQIERVIESSGPWKVQRYASVEQLEQDIRDGKISVGVVLKDTQSILYAEGDIELSQRAKMLAVSLKPAIESVINDVPAYLEVERIAQSPLQKEVASLEHILTGVMAISILSNGMFSMVTIFSRYRKQGALKRLIATGVKLRSFLIAVSIVRLSLSFLSLAFIILLSRVMFNAQLAFNWFMLVPTLIFSTFGMMAVGLLIALVFKQPNAASNVASLLNTFMMFFSGVYFPLSWMPSYFRWIGYVLPVKYVADLVRASAKLQLMSPSLFWSVNFVMLLAGLCLLWLSGKLFLRAE
ncbi:ABC transporter permease [Thermotoga caldifontis]|uniref:ABC transporter permease n=1 Tax=Thermotoga caldifontis TaxID=1508419 RepID=UPI0005975EDA|nr:ABC transporter permease [Thermotoga caldifontis]